MGAGADGVGAHVVEHEPVPHAHLRQPVPRHRITRRPKHSRHVHLLPVRGVASALGRWTSLVEKGAFVPVRKAL